jgi:hypothetical protein
MASVFELKEAMAEQLGLLSSQIELDDGQRPRKGLVGYDWSGASDVIGLTVRKIVAQRLPHLSMWIATKIQHTQIFSTTERLDSSSMTERRAFKHSSETNVQAAETVETIAIVLNLSDPTAASNTITLDGQPFVPYPLRPQNAGVECRSWYVYAWRSSDINAGCADNALGRSEALQTAAARSARRVAEQHRRCRCSNTEARG